MALALAACKAPETDPMAQGKVVRQLPAAAAEPARAPAEQALQAAESRWRAGDALTAFALANRALRDGVPADMESAFRALRSRARAAIVATKVVEVRAVPAKDAVADGTEIPVRIDFRNLSAATIEVPRTAEGSSDAALVLTLRREDWDVWGNTRTSEVTIRAPVKRDLVLEPGATAQVELAIPAEMARLTHQGFSVLALGGLFRPVALRVGGTEFFDAIPVAPGAVRVFLKGWEALAAEPLASLEKAVARRSPPHILTAAELLAPHERAPARAALEAAAVRDPPLRFVLEAALARLSALDASSAGR